MSKQSFVIVSICLILAAVYYFKYTSTGKSYVMRCTLNCSKCSKSENKASYKTVSHDNVHVDAYGIFSTCLFIRDRTSFMSKYYEPLLKYNKYARENYPGWYYRVYVPQNFDMHLKERMQEADMEVVTMAACNPDSFNASCWRFLPLLGNTPFLCCDTDSNDYQAYFDKVSEWRNDTSKCFFHLRGIPFIPWVSAGMWGCKPHVLPSETKTYLHESLINKTYCSCYGTDEVFVTKYVQPMFKLYGITMHEPFIVVWVEIVGGLLAILLVLFLCALIYNK